MNNENENLKGKPEKVNQTAATSKKIIYGIITDKKNGTPIENAEVNQKNTENYTFTDENGKFELELDPKGKKSVSVNAENYKSASFPIINGISYSFTLEPTEVNHQNTATQTNASPPAAQKSNFLNYLLIGIVVISLAAAVYFYFKSKNKGISLDKPLNDLAPPAPVAAPPAPKTNFTIPKTKML